VCYSFFELRTFEINLRLRLIVPVPLLSALHASVEYFFGSAALTEAVPQSADTKSALDARVILEASI
jgi:hypothetical protein